MSPQIFENAASRLRRQNSVLDVYVAQIPKISAFEPVVPALRQEEIESVKNPSLKRQKYAGWRLLEYALKNTFGVSMEKLSFSRSANGKWACGVCAFSLSHSKDAVAVALSEKPVGVDIQSAGAVRDERLAKKILTARETSAYAALTAGREEYLLIKWTEKESLFKKSDETAFRPSQTETAGQSLKTEKLTVSGTEYLLTVASDDFTEYRLFTEIELP